MKIMLKAGITSVEFWAETPFFWVVRNDEASISELKKALSIMLQGCTLHAPVMDLNPSSYNDLVHEATVSETLWSIELGDKIINVHVGAPHNGKPHYPAHYEKKMEIVLQRLFDTGYNGDLTIEIDDKTFPAQLSREDKITELIREREYLESIFCI